MPLIAPFAPEVLTPPRKSRLLVIGEHPADIQLLTVLAQDGGYGLLHADSGRAASQIVLDEQPDIVILSLCSRSSFGPDVITALRAVSAVPIVVLSTLKNEADKVYLFKLGADDVLSVPFSPRELMSRIKAILRRVALREKTPNGAVVQIDERVRVDFNQMEVIVAEKPIKLRPHELRLLRFLMENAGRILIFDTILAKVWGCNYFHPSQIRWVRIYICYLRGKLEEDPAKPSSSITRLEWGIHFLSGKQIQCFLRSLV